MLRKLLIVGVGGSGGKTLRVIQDDVLRKLRQVGWTKDRLPEAWQLLHIDVPVTADGGEDPDLPVQLFEDQYVGMVDSGVTYKTLDGSLVSHSGSAGRDALITWRPDPNTVNQPPQKGAGQYRALGRIITLAKLRSINKAIQAANNKLYGTGVEKELQEVTRLLGGSIGKTPEPFAIIISSIAGGTGAGAVIDVADVIRSLGGSWPSNSIGFLYSPDVFDYLGDQLTKGVRPNALATLSELLNGYWNSKGLSSSTTSLFAASQVILDSGVNRSGIRFPFLVGASNEKVTYKSQNEVYRAMGRSIASLVVSEKLQTPFEAYSSGNWVNTNRSLPDELGIGTSVSETPFNAIGSARLSLGRDRFSDYASQHLARSIVKRFTEQHLETRTSPKDRRTDREIIDQLRQNNWDSFLDRSQLNERKANDILRALSEGADINSRLREFQSDLSQVVKRELTGQSKGVPAESIGDALNRVVRDRRSTYINQLQAQTYDDTRHWVQHIQKHLAALAADFIGASGAPVTIALFEELDRELSRTIENFRVDVTRLSQEGSDAEQRANSAFAGIRRVKKDDDGPVIKAQNSYKQSLAIAFQIWLRKFAAEVISDFRTGYLGPLINAIKDANSRLLVDIKKRDSIITAWPERDEVPVRLQPAPNEFLLEPVEHYPDILSEQIRQTIDHRASLAETRRKAEIEALLHSDDSENAQALVEIDEQWIPENGDVISGSGLIPQKARVRLNASDNDLLRRAETWIKRDGYAIGRYLDQGLRDYLAPNATDPITHEQRLNEFEGTLLTALNAAAPLVSINKNVLEKVHHLSEIPYSTRFSEIPLPDNSPAKERLQELLVREKIWGPDVESSLTDGKGESIDLFTMLGAAFQPVVFDSIMKPIASEWGQKSKNWSDREQFWSWRRARPLTEFIPVPRSDKNSVLSEMIRGWFVAHQLNHLRLTSERAAIFDKNRGGDGAGWVEFPHPTLSAEPLNGSEALSVILAAMIVAMVEVNTQQDVRPMRPYQRLRDLGRNSDSLQDALNPELRAYLEDGGPAEVKERCEYVLHSLTESRKMYQDFYDKVRDEKHQPLDYPRSWDLRDEIDAALESLVNSVSAYASNSTLARPGGKW